MPEMSGAELAQAIWRYYEENNLKCPRLYAVTAQQYMESFWVDNEPIFDKVLFKPI